MESRNLTKIVRNMNLYKNTLHKDKDYLSGTEFELLRYVCKRESRSFNELVDYLNVDKGLVSRMIKKLSTLGYLEVNLDPSDSRKKIIKATSKARKIKDKNAEEEQDFYLACMKNLDEEEKKMFDELLNKVYLESKKLRKNSFRGISHEENKI